MKMQLQPDRPGHGRAPSERFLKLGVALLAVVVAVQLAALVLVPHPPLAGVTNLFW